jgi:hypothetical protein
MQPRKSKLDWTIANSTAARRRAAAVTKETLCLDPGIAGARQKAMSVSFLMRRLTDGGIASIVANKILKIHVRHVSATVPLAIDPREDSGKSDHRGRLSAMNSSRASSTEAWVVSIILLVDPHKVKVKKAIKTVATAVAESL